MTSPSRPARMRVRCPGCQSTKGAAPETTPPKRTRFKVDGKTIERIDHEPQRCAACGDEIAYWYVDYTDENGCAIPRRHIGTTDDDIPRCGTIRIT